MNRDVILREDARAHHPEVGMFFIMLSLSYDPSTCRQQDKVRIVFDEPSYALRY